MKITHNIDIPPPHFVASIDGLRRLSTSLSAFLHRYDDLNNHLDFVTTSIHSNLPNHLLTPSNPNQSTLFPSPEVSSSLPAKTSVQETINPNVTTSNCDRKPDNSKNAENPNISNNPEPEKPGILKKPALSSVDHFCRKMCGRGLKKYVTTNVSDVNKLREVVSKALKLAKDPAKLVFESIGRFYVQGSSAYTKDSTMVLGRRASVIILECFLLMSNGGIEISKTVEEDAEQAAVEWRQRIKNEGGFMTAEETDARGLLLLISGFGIPVGIFMTEDIRDLIRASNVKEISTALRRSKFLVPKVPEIIDQMVKADMEIEAVDVAYSLGVEDKRSTQKILGKFLRDNIKNRPHGSSDEVKEAIKKQLGDLKSIIKCLKAHKVDPSKLLPDWNLSEKLQSLEKEISDLDSKTAEKKASQKRKSKEAEPLTRPKQQDPKRSRLTGLDNGRLPYSTSSGLPETITNLVAVGSEGGQYAGGGMVTSSYGGQPYDWHGDRDLVEKYLGRTYLGQSQTYDSHPSSVGGLTRLYSGPERFGGSTAPGSPVGGSVRGGPPSGLTRLYSRPEGLAPGSPVRGDPPSDLYRFADSVVESESYLARGGSGAAAGSSSLHSYLSPPRRPSYFY